MTSVLHLNLHRVFFDQVLSGEKKTEWRDCSVHLARRLEGREYAEIVFRNGYSSDAPELVVEFLGVSKVIRKNKPMYAIKLGKLIAKRNISQ